MTTDEEKSMDYGVVLTGVGAMADPEKLRRAARKADQLGFHSLWLYEHVAFPVEIAGSYGKMPFTPEMGYLEPVTTLAYLAAETTQIRLGTGILLLALRHPLHVAKAISTLDVFSGGRVIFGVGLGWLAEEFQVLEIPFSQRAGRVRESVEILKELWKTGRLKHEGRYYRFPEATSFPLPLQPGGPPIWFGAIADAAIQRAVELGDGWLGGAIRADKLGEWITKVKTLAREKGKENFAIAPSVRPDISREDAERLQQFGATQLNLSFSFNDASETESRMEAAAQRLLG
jgi:probable F420-dependent oxidoreductase